MLYRLLYRRKRRDRWWRFLVLKNAFIRDSNDQLTGSSGDHGLRKAFKWFGSPTPPELTAFWTSLVSKAAARRPELHRQDLERIESEARELEPGLLPAMGWLDLFRLCIGIGFFETARILREKAFDRMLLDARAGSADLHQVTLACYAELERGQFDRAEVQLDRMSMLGCPAHRVGQARWMIALLAGKEPGSQARAAWAGSSDQAFEEAIAANRIALVGPVASESVQGAEIDQYDVVVKFGYRGGNQGREQARQGERIDIAYYNNTQAMAVAKSDYQAVFSELRWGVCHNRKGASCFSASLPNLRTLSSLQWFLPDTHLNAGPNAVIDLLRFSPAEIKIFNTDMMLSSGRFAGYRQPNDKPTDYTRSFIKTHDPILQYQIMHRLWTCGYITGDERFREVMAMGLKAYLAELQKAYGADTCALF